MKYLLDTKTCIFLMKNTAAVVNRYTNFKANGIAISSITAAELYFGVFNSLYPAKNGTNLINFLIGLDVLNFDGAAAMEYGNIRAMLRKNGTPVGSMDMLIAAHAKSAMLTLVTNNTRELRYVVGLNLTDWLNDDK